MSDIKDLNNEEVKDVAGGVAEDELLRYMEPKRLKPKERHDEPVVPYVEPVVPYVVETIANKVRIKHKTRRTDN